MEYFNHKYIFHYFPNLSNNKNIYYTIHGHHHKYPNKNPITPLPQTLFLYILSYLLFSQISSEYNSLICGGSFGFLIFELTHLFIHEAKNKNYNVPFLDPLIDFHIYHHHHSNKAYGFTSPYWDYLFCDLPNKKKYKWCIIPIPLPIIPFVISKCFTSVSIGDQIRN